MDAASACSAIAAGPERCVVSLGTSPGLLRHQNLDVLSFDPLHMMCPAGCHARDPHRRFVPSANLRRGSLPALTHQPIQDGAVEPAGGEKILVVRVPRHGRHLLRVPSEVGNFASVRTSNTFTCDPRHPLTSQFPFWFHFTHPTWFLCA